MNFYLAVTKSCNMRCKYCYVPEYNKKVDGDIDAYAIKNTKLLISKLIESHIEIGRVLLHGAEPLILQPETIMELHRVIYGDRKAMLGMQTNGLNMTKDYLEKLDKDKIALSVSLDGYKELNDKNRPNSYDRVLANIKTAISMGFKIALLCVITKDTVANADRFFKWVKTLPALTKVTYKFIHGDESMVLSTSEQILFTKKAIESGTENSLQFLRKDICINNGNDCVWYEFDMDGGVYSCNKQYSEEGKFADWKKEDIQEIIRKRVLFFDDYEISSECKECELYHVCRGGCPTDRIGSKSVDCEARRYLYNYRRHLGKPILHL